MIPKEQLEQEMLVKWLEFNKYDFWRIRNESDWRSFYKWAIRKKSWVKPWICDMWVILKRWSLLAIELKRQRRVLKSWKLWASPSVISEEQKEWIKKLNEIDNVSAEIAYWCDDAIKIIKHYENL